MLGIALLVGGAAVSVGIGGFNRLVLDSGGSASFGWLAAVGAGVAGIGLYLIGVFDPTSSSRRD